MAMTDTGRRGRPLWQWIVLGLVLFIISVALLTVGFFRYTKTGRELSNLTGGIVELARLSASGGEMEAETPMGQWVMRVRRGQEENNRLLQQAVTDLRQSGFLTQGALNEHSARAKARQGIDQYQSALRSVKAANVEIEQRAVRDLAGLPIPSAAREGLQKAWTPTFGALTDALEAKLAAEEAFIGQAKELYAHMDRVESGAGYRVVDGKVQFHTQADLDAFRQISGRLEELRAAAAKAHDEYLKAGAEFPRAFQKALEAELR